MKKKLYVVLTLLSLTALSGWIASRLWMSREISGDDLKASLMEREEENEKLRAGYPDKLLRWYYEQRAYPGGTIPAGWRMSAEGHVETHNKQLEKSASSLSWTQLGPRNIGGRIRSIIVDPADAKVIYIGSVGGGVWKTTNGGTHWFPLKDNMENLSIGSMVMDPSDHNTIYAGTGEGFFNYDALRGEGIFKTTDAGASWTQLPSTFNTNFYFVNRLVIDKSTNTLWAATRNGLYKSSDGGTNFTGVITANNIHCTDVKVAYTSPSTIYASFGLFTNFTVYRSTDAGNTFQVNYTYKYASMGRTELAVSSKNPLVAYLSSMDIASNKIGIMRSTSNGGASWDSAYVAGGSDTYTSTQAWYNNVLSVDPQDEKVLFAAGLDCYMSRDRGLHWEQMSYWNPPSKSYPFVHADNHALVFDPVNPNTIYIGNDGGIFRSTDKGNSWTSLNNDLYITQLYYGAVDPVANIYYGGAQDNGTLKSADGGTAWTEILSGDGGAVEVDYNNPHNVYMEYVQLSFFKSTSSGSSPRRMMNGIPLQAGDASSGTSDRVDFIAPFVIDPNNSSTLLAGTYRVYRTTDGAASWQTISSDLTGDGTDPQNGAVITSLAAAKGNSNVIYAACSNGRVQVSTDNGSSWNLRNTGLPAAHATRIAVSQNDPATAFVVYSGFSTSSGKKVFKTTDFGQTWTNRTGNLPNIPVNCILISPANADNLVAGTDLGIFVTSDGGNSWTQQNDGMANVPVMDLDFRSPDNKIFASTHGRGMFAAAWSAVSGLDSTQTTVPGTYDISQNYPNPFNPNTTIKYQVPSASNVVIKVYDIEGREVKQLVNELKQQGSYQTVWDGTNNSGITAASGVYFYRIQAGSFSKTMKMLLLR